MVAHEVWARFGDPENYVEPFFGSGAVLFARPSAPKVETVNDLDGLLANFWRAVQADPEAVAKWADRPVNESDMHAIHVYLIQRKDELQARLEGDIDFYDARAAGYWVWGLCCWIGSGWCSGKGPWHSVDGLLVNTKNDGNGTWRQLPHLGNTGRGINRKLPHLGNAGRGINRKLPHLGNAGQGINRKRPHLADCRNTGGVGIHARSVDIYELFQAISDRLRNVRVCCGDWSRVCGPSVTHKHAGITAVFLDPPYSDEANRDPDLYTVDCGKVAHDVRRWALENGDNPAIRIALCGYSNEHDMPDTWECLAWSPGGGFDGQGKNKGVNRAKERIFFSPHCIQADLFSHSHAEAP